MNYSQVEASIVEQLRSFAQEAGFIDCAIGLSGGLDSSVVAALCAQAFGVGRVHGVLLPGPYSSAHSVDDALALAANLGLEAETIPITGPYEAFARALEPHFAGGHGGSFAGVASENTQARCRMVVLMALSNAHGWMLVNTGNRSEALMGYCTLYGDMAGAFAPIGGLYKTQIRALAQHMNEQAAAQGRTAPIPERVLAKPPSAELSENQTDEDGLGIGYAQLDRILAGHFDEGSAPEDLVTEEMPLDQVQSVIARAESNAFKRASLPPSARI